MTAPPAGQAPIDLSVISFVTIRSVADRSWVDVFLQDLDLGGSEALALAIELTADLLLIDEVAGRARSKEIGLESIGVLGVLLEAKRAGLLDSISPLLDQLQWQHRFHLSKRVRSEVLRRAGEA